MKSKKRIEIVCTLEGVARAAYAPLMRPLYATAVLLADIRGRFMNN